MWPVVPLVGTWIEIAHILIFLRSLYVVPLVGTWIEISTRKPQKHGMKVVPLVGTWIEIVVVLEDCVAVAGRSPCGNVD